MKKILLIVALAISSLNVYAMDVQEAFFKAVADNNPAGVKAAIDNGADINKIDPKTGTTALYQALLRVDKHIGKNWIWVLPLVTLTTSAITSNVGLSIGLTTQTHLSRATKAGKTYIEAGSERPWYLSTEAPKENIYHIPIDKVKKVRNISFIISLGSAIATALIGKVSYKFLTDILKSQKIALILITSPNIKIDAMTDTLRKQITSKEPIAISKILGRYKSPYEK